jgi:hypothetical protein
MKNFTNYAIAISAVVLLLIVTGTQSCRKEADTGGSGDPAATVNPSDAVALSKVLIVPADATRNTGPLPTPSGGSTSPIITGADSTISYTSGGQIRLPISYVSPSGGIGGIYFQVDGSNEYFNVPSYTTSAAGTLLLPIKIPSNVANGKFCITISIFTQSGAVSQRFRTCVTVTSPQGCGAQRVSGGEGVTSTVHRMGSNAGVVVIDYETFTVPDRIDVFYNGIWVAGTGSNPGPLGMVPPLADCSRPTSGYIGANGKFCFQYDPTLSGEEIEVVVSGCVRGGTAWKYTINCPNPAAECLAGQDGDPRFSLKFDQPVDFDLHVKDPAGEEVYFSHRTSASGGKLDQDCIGRPGYENIYWESGSAPSGTYEYWVKFYSAGSASSSNYTLTVTRNGNVLSTQTGSLATVKGESPHYTHVQ